MLLDHDEPTNYEEAMMSPDSAKWLKAMKSEMGSMYENKVWTLIDLPDDRWAIQNKWIFKRKTDADSSVTIYKARIVAKGFRQVQGVNYDEIFSLVAMLKSVRIILAIATFYEIWQMDVKTELLNGFIKEEFMLQPKGFLNPKGAKRCASSSDPSMGWCKNLGVGIYALMNWSKHIVLYRLAVKPVFTRKWVGALQPFW